MTATQPQRSLRFRLIRSIVLGTLVMFVVSALALVIYTQGARSPKNYTLDIPLGANKLIAAGQNPLEIPRNWTFLADDTLTLVNHDTVDHTFGSFLAPAGVTSVHELQPVYAGSFLCTLHPSGSIVIDVDVRDFDWRLLLAPTLALGPALGLVGFAIGSVMRALEDGPDEVLVTQPSDSM